MKSRITPEEFVKAWQSSNSWKEVLEKTGITYQSAYNRAKNYRKKGVNLKKLNTTVPRLDVDALNALCDEQKKTPPRSD